MPDDILKFDKPEKRGYDVEKIGETTFLVFANGMVAANEVIELRYDGDECATIRTRSGGWVVLGLKRVS